jgi:hypothetical protein
MRHIPALALPSLRTRSFAHAFAEREARVTTLYEAIRDVTGAELIVDSSKDPTYAWFLRSLNEVDLRIVNLIRDPRAVAHSWTRIRRRPEIPDDEAYMRRFPATRSAWNWTREQLILEPLRHVARTRLRYEDLVNDPSGTVQQILRFAGLSTRSERTGEPFNHSISGNPTRFGDTTPAVVGDDEWMTAMTTADRWKVTLMTFPLLARYGYPMRTKMNPIASSLTKKAGR